MAWKFVQEYAQDGDIVEPSEWRINMNEMFSEINGFLDSDNIGRSSVGNSQIKRNAFTQVHSNDLDPQTSYVFPHEQSGWVSHAATISEADSNTITMHVHPASIDAHREASTALTVEDYLQHLDQNHQRLPSVVFDPDQDGLLICEFSGWVSWMPQSTNNIDIDRRAGPGDGTYFGKEDPTEQVTLGFGDQVCGYGFFAQQTQNFKHLSSYVLCSLWRIVVNGQVVAETGPLGNDYQSHPIYLCGTTPITKGVETIVQLESQFVWYSHGAEQDLPSSSFNPTRPEKDNGRTFRMDCSLNCPTLLVTHRKR